MKYILIISLLIAQTILPTKAVSNATYVIYGDMPSIILLQMDSNKHIEVTALPTSLILNAACTSHSTRLTALLQPETKDCFIDTIEAAFTISVDHTVFLDTAAIDKAFPQQIKGNDLVNMDTLTSYFHTLSSNINFSFLWSYKKYITTDLSLWDLKDLFPIFTSDQVEIQYQYPHMIGDEKHWYILHKHSLK